MNDNVGPIVRRVMLAVGLVLVLGSQACEDRKVSDQAPGKVLEAAAPNPAVEKPAAERREASASADSTAEASREGPPAGSSK